MEKRAFFKIAGAISGASAGQVLLEKSCARTEPNARIVNRNMENFFMESGFESFILLFAKGFS